MYFPKLFLQDKMEITIIAIIYEVFTCARYNIRYLNVYIVLQQLYRFYWTHFTDEDPKERKVIFLRLRYLLISVSSPFLDGY